MLLRARHGGYVLWGSLLPGCRVHSKGNTKSLRCAKSKSHLPMTETKHFPKKMLHGCKPKNLYLGCRMLSWGQPEPPFPPSSPGGPDRMQLPSPILGRHSEQGQVILARFFNWCCLYVCFMLKHFGGGCEDVVGYQPRKPDSSGTISHPSCEWQTPHMWTQSYVVATEGQTSRGATQCERERVSNQRLRAPTQWGGCARGRIPRREITRREDHQLFEVKPF